MKKILLMDTLSTIHVGNGALLENTIKLSKEAYGDCEFHIMTMDIETNKIRYDNLSKTMFGDFWFGRGKIGKLLWAVKESIFMFLQILNEYTIKISSEKLTFNSDQKKAVRTIQECDICVSCGGEMINDTFYQMLPFWLFSYWFAIKKGKKFILFPQSVGPLKKSWTRKLTKITLGNASLLVGRDKASYEELLSLGFEPNKVMFIPDVAIQQEIGKADIHTYFFDVSKKVIGVTISNPPFQEIGHKVDFVSEVAIHLENLDPSIYKILIMPSNYIREGISADYALCTSLQERLSQKFETTILQNRPYFPDEYTALLSQLEFFISTRMHVAILATSIFTPTIAINTQHKIRGYMENIDMGDYCIEMNDLNSLGIFMNNIIKNRKTISKKLEAENKKLKKEQDLFIQRLKDLND